MKKVDSNPYHSRFQYGILYPSNVHGIGTPADLMSFFGGMLLVTDKPDQDYPLLWSLQHRPVFGYDMLELFDEVKRLYKLMDTIVLTPDILTTLNLSSKTTKLKTEEPNLVGLFKRIFFVLNDAQEVIALRAKRNDDVYESGSIRLGPIEPLVASSLFHRLPSSAFDEQDPPLWLREEIFNESFYDSFSPS